jgi:hypothetical protein
MLLVGMTNKALTIWINTNFQIIVFKMSVSGLVKKKELLNFTIGSLIITTLRKVCCHNMKQATFNWFKVIEEHGTTLSDGLIIATMKCFYGIISRSSSKNEL